MSANRMPSGETATLNALSETVIGAAFRVSNTLGVGFLEKVYERALLVELAGRGLQAEAQVPLTVFYEGQVVGEYLPDILVERRLVLELKAVKALEKVHFAQLLNALRASNLKLGLLINFGKPRIEWHRVVNDL